MWESGSVPQRTCGRVVWESGLCRWVVRKKGCRTGPRYGCFLKALPHRTSRKRNGAGAKATSPHVQHRVYWVPRAVAGCSRGSNGSQAWYAEPKTKGLAAPPCSCSFIYQGFGWPSQRCSSPSCQRRRGKFVATSRKICCHVA